MFLQKSKLNNWILKKVWPMCQLKNHSYVKILTWIHCWTLKISLLTIDCSFALAATYLHSSGCLHGISTFTCLKCVFTYFLCLASVVHFDHVITKWYIKMDEILVEKEIFLLKRNIEKCAWFFENQSHNWCTCGFQLWRDIDQRK